MNIQAPFGGKKSSGIGREFGEYVSVKISFGSCMLIEVANDFNPQALRAFTEPKTILIK